MKLIALLFILCIGCTTTTRFYNGPDVALELEKNKDMLQYIVGTVEADFSLKAEYYQNLAKQTKNKDTYMVQDLAWRLSDLESKKNSILAKASYIKNSNENLNTKVKDRPEISEKDPTFRLIEAFSQSIIKDAKNLFVEFDGYRKASNNFGQFAKLSKTSSH